MLFSERKGLKSYAIPEQKDSLDDGSRNILWSLIHGNILRHVTTYDEYIEIPASRQSKGHNADFLQFIQTFWMLHLRHPSDELDYHWHSLYRFLRNDFFQRSWNEVYDFLEFLLQKYPDAATVDSLVEQFNDVFEHDNIPYRFIDKILTDVSDDITRKSIAEALEHPLAPVQEHIRAATQKLYDRKKPDFRNSIKESISAVEALCRKLSGKENATLGDALKTLEQDQIHPALSKALGSLYGYTSDSKDGIRHALADSESNVEMEDARFMLVTCSAFIHYLTEKAARLKIKLK